MAKHELPSPETLRKLLRYEPGTGRLFWIERDRGWFATDHEWRRWNTRYAGTVALGAAKAGGYLTGKVLGVRVATHRVIWAMETGTWPVDQVDHINGRTSDNRLENLREASAAENGRNKRRQPASSRYQGVSRHKANGCWTAYICVNGRSKHLGSFNDEEVAARARDRAARVAYGEFARLNFP